MLYYIHEKNNEQKTILYAQNRQLLKRAKNRDDSLSKAEQKLRFNGRSA